VAFFSPSIHQENTDRLSGYSRKRLSEPEKYKAGSFKVTFGQRHCVHTKSQRRTLVWGQTRGWAAGGSNKHQPQCPWMPGGQGTALCMSRRGFCFSPKINLKEKKVFSWVRYESKGKPNPKALGLSKGSDKKLRRVPASKAGA